MGDRAYLRPYSPPRRAGGHPGRNSASFLDSHSAGYDPYYAYPRSSRDSIPMRPAAEAPRRNPPRESLPLRRNVNDYDIPPRRAETSRRPAAVPPPADSPKYRPIIKSATDRSSDYSRARPRDDESYYLMPASSSRGHHRALSTGAPRDASYPVRAREPHRERGDREYDRGSRQYYNIPAIRQPRDKDDRDFGFEYTDHKEQARRDLLPVPRQRVRRESDAGPHGRPASIAGVEDLTKRSGRGDRPPVTTRGFSKIDGNGNVRHEYRIPRDSEATRSNKDDVEPISHRRSTREGKRDSLSLHQDRADGYSSTTEDSYKTNRSRGMDDGDRRAADSYPLRYEDAAEDKGKRHHERRLSASHEDSRRYLRPRGDDREYPRAESARRDRDKGMEREYVRRRDRDEDLDREHRRHDRGEDRVDRERRHRRKHDDDYERGSDETREERSKPPAHRVGEGAAAIGAAAVSAAGIQAKRRYEPPNDESPASKARGSKDDGRPSQKGSKDALDDERESDRGTEQERRERRRARRREREEIERQEAAARGKDDVEQPPGMGRDAQAAAPGSRKSDDKDRRGRRQSKVPSDSDSKSGDDGTESRRVQLVDPAKEPEAKPKGILKSPRVKFPEDPAPVREGVAPLKDAGKKGIPANARWTKIDRRLVNPEALEFGNERFEERSDYVIVLRVLSKEEIEAYAAKTAEIREERHREAARRNQPLALEDRPYGYDEDESPQLALDNRPYNEPDMSIPGITDRNRHASIPGIVVGDGQASAPPVAAMAPPPGQAPHPATQGNAMPVRPEVYPTTSYHRVSPNTSNSVPPPNYGGPTYPAPPPLQSSPMPQQAPLSGPPPPSGLYAQQSSPPNAYAPVHISSLPNPATYPPPPGAYGQQSYPPPPPPLGTEPSPLIAPYPQTSPPGAVFAAETNLQGGGSQASEGVPQGSPPVRSV